MDLPHLRDIRRRAILSQEQLAELSGVARDTISKLETGKRRAYPSTIRKLAGGLEIEPRMLLGGVEFFDDPEAGPGAGDEDARDEPEEKGGRRVGF